MSDFRSDGLDDWLSDGIDGRVRIEFVDAEPRRRSAGTLFRRGRSEIWTARYTDEDGRRVDRTTGCISRSDAEAVLSRWVEEARILRLESRKGRSPKKELGDAERVLALSPSPKTIRELVESTRGIRARNDRLVVCRGGLIEIRDLDEGGRQQGGVYSVPVEEARTLSGRLEWIRHLCEKSWITPTHILKFIEACEQSIGGAR